MVILSCHEIGNGIDARGWLYSGMAIRLAFDLALNLDMSAYASKGDITPEDADLRRTVFWAAYLVDHQLGFHLGRPFRTSMEDVTVGKPHD
ncbi:transcriptional regulator family: Fungal Specific TF [Paecilomyces variotii]|nr:transcriptional regulator family: Fungal Specific TF [Paecilomyces variotii]KAJ9236153.1 transcriptional regulator family: Fungal Specific TF [Paecilomyces variotii]